MSKETRRSRYQKTASTLRFLLNYGRFPAVDRLKYFGGYRAFELFQDRYGVWLKLMRTDRFIAIIERSYVRIDRNTVYRPILEDFARRTQRRIAYTDRLTPASRRLFSPATVDGRLIGTQFPITPFTVTTDGQVMPRTPGNTLGILNEASLTDAAINQVMDTQGYTLTTSASQYYGQEVVNAVHDTTLDNLPF